MVAEIGLEPTTCRVWTGCSSQLSYSAIKIKMVEPRGIEPLTPCVQGRCSPSWAMTPQTWSEWQDLNLQPSGPKPDALPSCATFRWQMLKYNIKRWRIFQYFFYIFFSIILEVPVGLEPAIIELQSIALPTWLRNQLYYYTISFFCWQH